ncbi:MAG: PKD domain-containing protein [Flavobacteriales bacterium]
MLAASAANATHIVGGDMRYTYIGNNGFGDAQYQIYLTVYRDCDPNTNVNGTGFDDEAQIGVYDSGDLSLYLSSTMDLGSAEVDWVPVELENPCFVLPPDVCIERAEYSEIFTLPMSVDGYTITYSRCCRNASIVNLDNPQDQGTTITVHIPGVNEVNAAEPNSSAQFVNFPPVALCANAEFWFDASASDVDGDSLSYHFCTPFQGGDPDFPAPAPANFLNLNPVDFDAGFTYDYPVTSNPQLLIDPETGQMNGTATEIGRYTLAICVDEFRDGVLINTIMRDFQFNVTLCDPNIIASTSQEVQFCVGDPVQFANNSTNGSTFFWDFGVENIDSDTSIVEFPSYTFPTGGSYTVMLVANPGWQCADTAYSTVSSFSVISPVINVGAYQCINDEDTYSFTVTGNASANALYTWNFGAGSIPATSTLQSPGMVQMNGESASFEISVVVTDFGCPESAQVSLSNEPDPVAGIIEQTIFCDGLGYQFTNESNEAETYLWTMLNAGQWTQISTATNPYYWFAEPGVYTVELFAAAPNTCPDSTTTQVEISAALNTFFQDQGPQCFEGNSFSFTAEGFNESDATFAWSFGNVASPSVSTSLSVNAVTYNQTGWHTITLTIFENTCSETYTDSVWVVQNFENDFAVNSEPACPPAMMSYQAESVAGVPVYYSWNFGDGGVSSSAGGNYYYNDVGSYNVSVTAYTMYGCVESETAYFPNAAAVLTTPIPGFSITPQILDILEPTVQVADSSIGGVTCFYMMSDGGESNDCEFTYEWSEAGIQTITQFVTNEQGCSASITGQVFINGFLFFAPNTFTPNNDGLNDIWLPESTGITMYTLRIFNRWGEVIFETNDWTLPWTGQVHNGDYFAQDGVYFYHVQAEDLMKLPHEYRGHIILTR